MKQFLNFLLEDRMLLGKSEKLTLNKGDRLILESNDNQKKYVYGITEGIISLNRKTEILDFLGTNQFLGLVSDENSKVHGEVLTLTATVWRLELYDVLSKVVQDDTGLLLFNKHLMNVCDNLMKKASIMRLNSTNRLLISIRNLALRFGMASEHVGLVTLPCLFTHKVLSDYIGVQKSTMIDLLNKLAQNEKIVCSRGVISVHV
ncbi:Crp/Fnr family transcriptional regulator [Listeria booriae]|uniref:Crp/Fnr family transcriptional regulator n=1 Tax=Listeria booriae TaxID=1552123 RepID=UPI002880B71B|nr:Crp/Fnr family transcriptional regulator [Listeria booriae]MDT0110970.1 Crp/Fnr family transcriptional regulator [Listeria booriae]